MLGLRRDGHAQWEIRQYAEAICKIVQDWVPYAFEAWEDYEFYACTFSRQEMEVLRQLVAARLDSIEHDHGIDKRAFFKSLFEAQGVETVRERADFLKKLQVVLT
jgi:thymidylate synthase (FAD)